MRGAKTHDYLDSIGPTSDWRRGSESPDFRLSYGVSYSPLHRFQQVFAITHLCRVMGLLDILLDVVLGGAAGLLVQSDL